MLNHVISKKNIDPENTQNILKKTLEMSLHLANMC